SDDLSFKFKNFSQNGKDLSFQGNASVIETGVLQLNKVGNNLPDETGGIARYIAPIHIWNCNTGELASFITSFSFFMETSANPKAATDGLTFFLAPPDSPLRRAGGYFGLFNDTKCDSSYQTVAVEFDTIGSPVNFWDPGFPHIGIDVNCVKSINAERWNKRYGLNNVANVEIIYEASSKTLTASLTYPSDQTSISVTSIVDLKEILPEWVSVGFSGSTYIGRQATHEVLNWYFTSTFINTNS
uniref:ANTI-H(O) LECTIN I n=1 Tax=Ulex europaeus TaxID=3902 RepID=UPI00001117E8|nr:Chain A, ANTI-H(O) LECTIN I [Ulex europaeus]1FX5_B Chain B, ANTI-H(O) LECTIN I [Ulex europaeus]1JXN_A Chain A, anti-H(O) lectin I [Ulex europaeus]1JXN_B Chain B, anti-H(O) lectin I [Ulex europaeus]1JXN_C Chain C, anti-H(O) lectin I [Ulex europaeus]1JXN_D Chain D, anti-H(O) lectin I [Ulex europaeus]